VPTWATTGLSVIADTHSARLATSASATVTPRLATSSIGHQVDGGTDQNPSLRNSHTNTSSEPPP
jgi:hypothetical protein